MGMNYVKTQLIRLNVHQIAAVLSECFIHPGNPLEEILTFAHGNSMDMNAIDSLLRQ